MRAQYSGCQVTTCARHKHEDMFVSIQTQIFARTLTLPGIKIGLIVGIVSVIFLYWNLDIAVGILTSDEMIKYHSINMREQFCL